MTSSALWARHSIPRTAVTSRWCPPLCRRWRWRWLPRCEALSTPLDRAAEHEQRLHELAASALAEFRKLPASAITTAVKLGSIAPVLKSVYRKRFREILAPKGRPEEGIRGELAAIAERGARDAARDLAQRDPLALMAVAAARKPILLDPEIAELAGNYARYRGATVVGGLDVQTRASLRRLIRNAARRLARNPKAVVLAELAAEIQKLIGLTTHQTMAIQKWRRKATKAGTFTVSELDRRIAAGIERRAAAMASRELAEAYNEGVLRAARLAEKKNRLRRGLPGAGVMKHAHTQEDGRQRLTHQGVADSGPVRLDALFPVVGGAGGEDRPPWSGEHG